MNKKFALLVMTGSLTLAACGNNPAPTPTATKPDTSVTTPVTKPTTPVTKPSEPSRLLPAGLFPTGAYYINAEGQAVGFTKEQLENAGSNFVFYAWLEDKANGVTPANLATGGTPTADEIAETAPTGTQNMTAAYVGFKAPDGKIYPVVGAEVRWDINGDKSATQVRFATADDGGMPSGAVRPQDVNDNAMSAATWTNSSTGTNTRFPSSQRYPIYNQTGVATPDTDGFTWTALWVPSGAADIADVSAVAMINGTEIDKTNLIKTFAPTARLSINKEVVGTGAVGQDQNATFNITVTNTGSGPATNIALNDVLSGEGRNDVYAIDPVTADGAANIYYNNDDGFDASFDLQPGESRTFTFQARASAVGVYCDVATITSYDNGAFGTIQPYQLRDDSCLTVTAPELYITKTLVDAAGNAIADGQQVAKGQPVYARITVVNGGTAAATNVTVSDRLRTSNGASYAANVGAVVAAPQAVAVTAAEGDDGFDTAAFDLAAGASQTFTFPASATVDGNYCDNAVMVATSNNGQLTSGTSQNACFTVVSPALSLNKFNTTVGGTTAQTISIRPGQSYDSVINVTNTGSGAATGVQVSDVLGNLKAPYNVVDGTANDLVLNYGSGTYTTSKGQTGSLVTSNNGTTVSLPSTLTLAPDEELTIRITTTAPIGTAAGEYCNEATVTTLNAGSLSKFACVVVRNVIGVATNMVDNLDPVVAGPQNKFYLTSYIAVEPSSNQAAATNRINFNFGSTDSRAITAGVFNLDGTEVYYNPSPSREPNGQLSDPQAAFNQARLLTVGTDYTINTTDGAQQTVYLNDQIGIGGVVFFRHTLNAPVGTPERAYNSGLVWSYTGANNGVGGETSVVESTTIQAP